MSIIKIDKIGIFKYNYKITNKKFNIICISLFKMKNSYRELKVYTDGILEIYKHYKKYFPDFILRVYYDNSVIDDDNFIKLYNILDKNKQQLIHFDCPKFKIDKKYHRGIFGMIMRYIPYFKFENNDAKLSIVLDAEPDFNHKIDKWLSYFRVFINKFIKSDAQFFRNYQLCTNHSHIPNQKDWILGFMNASKYKFDIHMIQKFLNDDLNEYKKNYPILYQNTLKMKDKNDSIFFYGIDEIFLATEIKTFLDKNKIKYMTYVLPHHIHFYYVLLEIIFKNSINHKNKKEYDKITKIINNKLNKNFINFKDVLKYIGKNYDYIGKTDKNIVYKIMRKIFVKIYEKKNKKYIDLLNINDYRCLFLTDKYYDDTNSLIITN